MHVDSVSPRLLRLLPVSSTTGRLHAVIRGIVTAVIRDVIGVRNVEQKNGDTSSLSADDSRPRDVKFSTNYSERLVQQLI